MPGRIGLPVYGAGRQSIPSKRSSASFANLQHISTWSSARTLTQKPPLGPISCQLSEVNAGRKPTSGGSNETDVNEPIVRPDGFGGRSEPRGVATSPVTTVTPVGKCPRTWRKRRESNTTRPETRGAAGGDFGRTARRLAGRLVE